MKTRPARPLAAAALALSLASAPAAADQAPVKPAGPPANAAERLDVPFEKYRLPNGLTVILHVDHALPMATVDVLVRVGSHYERQKRTGFAHLFEHLMFMGTDRAPTGTFDGWMEAEGGWNNAWTSEDQTNYYDVGPAHVLPLLLWLEADRLGSLGRTMTQKKLDAQRDVVRNERRQTSENTPYGKVGLRLPELLFPEGHPYHHPVIGSHADLEAASVEDVQRFFAEWYVPRNLTLVVAGDFEPAVIKPVVEKWFGLLEDVAPQPAPVVPQVKLDRVVRERIEDDVELEKLVFAWHSPPRYAQGDAELDLLGAVLTRGKASRLYKTLVYERQLAQSVSASQSSGERGSYFEIEVLLRPKTKAADVEKLVLKEIEQVRSQPVKPAELSRAAEQFAAGFVLRLQSLSARATMLAQYEAAHGDPGWAEKDLARYRGATAEGVRAAARAHLDPKAFVLVHAVPKKKAAEAKPAGKKGGK